jgi:hypothetical protein
MAAAAPWATLAGMNASLLFAFELHQARQKDLLRKTEQYRLGRIAPARDLTLDPPPGRRPADN